MSKLTFLDIETSPNRGTFWRPGYKVNLSANNIDQERVILCAAWAHDDGEVHYTDALKFNKAPKGSPYKYELDDTQICRDIAEESAILVHHNGNSFDVPWINGRCLINGLPTIGQVRNLDTYRIAKRTYNLNSYRLDYLAKVLNVETGQKIKTSYDLWLDVMNNDKQAYEDMIDYNIQDVNILRAVYNKLRPGMSGITWANMVDDENSACPSCGQNHKKLHKRGTVPNLKTYYHRYSCSECGGWSRGPNLRR
jgi:DNA polymerase elongation subunit (family B)